jgi:hypothetical protein
MIGFIGSGLVSAQKQGTLPSVMSQFVTGTGSEAEPARELVWPLFFNTLVTGFYSWIALAIAALVAWQVVPNVLEMGTEERRARDEGKVVGDDHDPMISREIDEYEMHEGATPDWRNFATPSGR